MAEKPATRTRTSRTPRPRAVAKPQPLEESIEAPALVFTSRKDKPKEERIPLFSIDGEVFTVPKEPSPAIGVRFLDNARRVANPLQAGLALVEDMVGSGPYQKLLAWDDLDDDRLTQIINECIARALGGVSESAKN